MAQRMQVDESTPNLPLDVPNLSFEGTSLSPLGELAHTTSTFTLGGGDSPPSPTGSQDSCHMEDPMERGEMDVKVRPSNIMRVNSAIHAGMPTYKMEAKPRGLALIIEIEEYVDNLHEKRLGSEIDRDNLDKLFQQLHFTVSYYMIEMSQISMNDECVFRW